MELARAEVLRAIEATWELEPAATDFEPVLETFLFGLLARYQFDPGFAERYDGQVTLGGVIPAGDEVPHVEPLDQPLDFTSVEALGRERVQATTERISRLLRLPLDGLKVREGLGHLGR